MAEITPLDNGPFMVKGDVKLVDAEGKEYETKQQFALCRCGLSANKPFCNGAHRGKFEDASRTE
jgi:CDGSH-type Zn-finger protein